MRPTAGLARWLGRLVASSGPVALCRMVALVAAVLVCGCATPPLDRARGEFYTGRLEQADNSLSEIPDENKDRVLFLMERGMIRQALGDYDESSADWRAAAELNELLETYSITRGVGSLVASDRVLSFRGMPYERTLLYTFLANNYLAQYNWDYAAICARNIIQHLENRGGFPDIAYSRYMAGFCLELIGDSGNAALQYRTASELLTGLMVDEHTGRIGPHAGDDDSVASDPSTPYELVCFVAMGRAQPGAGTRSSQSDNISAPYADFYVDGKHLGRSHLFNNTEELRRQTEEQLALLQFTKDVSRIAAKETISRTVERHNDLLGFLLRLTLFALEAPDSRHWGTLPLWVGIARLPSPNPITGYTVVFRDAGGNALHTKTITDPISRRGNLFISFCRDIPEAEGDGRHSGSIRPGRSG